MRNLSCTIAVLVFVFFLSGKNFNVPRNRKPFHPFITGDGFRNFSDFAYDETVNRNKFPYEEVKNGDVVFIKTDFLDEFFTQIHPKINVRYIVITHNSAHSAPGRYKNILDDEKLIAWFSQNPDCVHDKLIPIPLGLENRYNLNGNLSLINEHIFKKNALERTILLYVNFSLKTHEQRREVYNQFKNKSFCTIIVDKISYQKYLDNLFKSHFVLSPRGRGLDCLRIWESIYLGAIPIVKTSPMDSLLADLPVVIVKEWSEVNPEFLDEQYTLLKKRAFAMKKIWIDYWLNLITTYKEHV